MASNANSGGRKASDRGTSQLSESSRRKDAEQQRGHIARGKTQSEQDAAQTAREASTSSKRTTREVSKGQHH